MGIQLVLPLASLPLWIAVTVLCAICLPLRRPAGGLISRVAGEFGMGIARAVIAPLLALGILVACQVAGALLQGAASSAASQPVQPRERAA